MKSATFFSPFPRLWWIVFAILSVFLHNAIACTALWNIAVTDNCLLDMAYTCPEEFANYVRNASAPHRSEAVHSTTAAGKRLPGSTMVRGNTKTPKLQATTARPTDASAKNGECKDIQVIDYRDHVFLVNREDDANISVAVFKHEWTITRDIKNVTTMNSKPIRLHLQGVDGQSPDSSYDQILGGIWDHGKKAPCKFSNNSFHAFIDYHTLYVTVECSSDKGWQYALMRSVVYILQETGEVQIVTPPQDLIYLDKKFANTTKDRLASVYAPNDFETVGDALLISYEQDKNNKKQLNLAVVELHSVNDTSGHLNISLSRAIGAKEWPLTQIVNIQHDDSRNRVAFVVIYGEVDNRTSEFFVLPDPNVTRPGWEKLQHVTKDFKLRPLKNFTSLPMEQYVYYGVHPRTPKLQSDAVTKLTLHIGPELSPYLWAESFDPFEICEISNADISTCAGKLEYKRKVNWLLVALGAWELLAIIVFIILFILGIWLQRRRNTKKRRKNRKGAKGKDANNNGTQADTTEATTNNDKTTDASTAATTVDVTKREQQPDDPPSEKTAKSSQVEKKKENAKSDDVPPELRSGNHDNQKTK